MIRRQAILHQNHRAAGPARVRFGVSAILIASAMLACQPALTRADGSGDSLWSWADGAAGNRQFYLGGIVGADFATLDKFPDAPATVPNQSIFKPVALPACGFFARAAACGSSSRAAVAIRWSRRRLRTLAASPCGQPTAGRQW